MMWWIESDLDSGVFVIHSGAFLFPVHGWQDRCVVRLAELAGALADVTPDRVGSLEFEGGRYVLKLQHESTTDVRVLYYEQGDGGLLYQERVRLAVFREELAKVIDSTLNQLVQRRSGSEIALLSAARSML